MTAPKFTGAKAGGPRLFASAWRCLELLQLPASSYPWVDKSAPATGKRFYRAVVMEAPTNMVFMWPGTFRMGSATNEVERAELGQVALTESELSGLDELLRFYRAGPPSICTTRDTITISQVRGGRIIATEQFTDGSGATGFPDGVTTFSDIIRRL